MTTYTAVPAETDPTSILDLVEDCRQFAGALGAPPAERTLPECSTGGPVRISAATARSLAGFGEYGS